MVNQTQISCEELIIMWRMANQHLKMNIDAVNSLNVFPVPDGDTGTNMYLTLQSAVGQIHQDDHHLGHVAARVAKGSLMGARGNSGVILSQILRGIGDEMSSLEYVDGVDLARALQKGVETAYKAVMRPVEGTILTVCKDAARQAETSAAETENIVEIMQEIISAAKRSLQNTPNLLPVLKKAGVVDAGGKGLLVILEGWYLALTGAELPEEVSIEEPLTQNLTAQSDAQQEYGYCTEFIIKADEQHVPALITKYEQMGDSLVIVGADDIIKVHIHSLHPGKILEKALQYGSLTRIKIENMQEQHTHILEQAEKAQMKDIGVIAVSVGEGMSEIFLSMGAHKIIQGGQTMNPSIEDIVKAIESLHAKHVIILPNNSNIILTAQQCSDLVEAEVHVIPSKTMPQGLSAMMAFEDSVEKIDEVVAGMTDHLSYVTSGQVTFATRDFEAECGNIVEGDIIGIVDGEIVTIGKAYQQVVLDLVDKMVDEDSEVITVYVGQDVAADSITELEEQLVDNFDQCDIEVHQGDQPLYYYIVSVE